MLEPHILGRSSLSNNLILRINIKIISIMTKYLLGSYYVLGTVLCNILSLLIAVTLKENTARHVVLFPYLDEGSLGASEDVIVEGLSLEHLSSWYCWFS